MRLGKIRKIHFVGIGGIGMSGIAEVLLNQDYMVSGSDLQSTDITKKLASMGAAIHQGHQAEHVRDADVLIYSSAVTPDNVEVQEAYRLKIPVIKRAEMLGELMRLKYGIAISGTHGKTTTTSLTGAVLTEGGLDPTLIIGGKVRSMDTNAKLGGGDFLVAEADEFDRSFLSMIPTIAVVTNIEAEHLDCYTDMEDLKNAFKFFANKVPFYGKVIACLDSPGVQEILQDLKRTVDTYGYSSQADLTARNLQFYENCSQFDVYHRKEYLGAVKLNLPGRHNIQNALASIAVGLELEVPFTSIQEALQGFSGINRRFEIKGYANDIMVVDDYAHHPTEINATLEGARNSWPERRIIAVFQPHLYSRTHRFYKEFARSFFAADTLLVTDVYPAREKPIEGVSGQLIAEAAIAMGHKQVLYIEDKQKLAAYVENLWTPGDLIITFGAGDIWKCANQLAERLESATKSN
ncbi:MAG: UDP-N-acetylmuramate--L-alanine ligase [Gammaproteobacteria bacterium]|nr:UDP-N-acetylmuramate--L-alanine ligase [Gammaproteobacteria bacterium]NIT52860.1 UDP-N-acetylmuramate--L-alanine ligase [candidate division Zixibacteria bacterium]NIW43958.1 UDP-N-acetylmuramate--L-alanine ligase [Gammaproteobacteria bacterium]NIX55065.1 UDP-N-acetylmuramate--L-alanine ligase [candidate division Zixibacteria bacterium]